MSIPAGSPATSLRVLIVGGGIAGLAAAYRVIELAAAAKRPVEVRLFEATDRLGGNIVTHRRDGFLIEGGPDSFITQKPWGLALCRRLGIAEQLLPTQPQSRRTFVTRNGRLHPVPEGFLLLAPTRIMPFVTTRLFSWPGKLRMALDLVLPRRDHGTDGDESLASFVKRRFGREALDRVAQPLVGGIYTADPAELGLRATMPRFLELESAHRSIILGMRRAQKASGAATQQRKDAGVRYSMFVSFPEGMQTLTEAVAGRLPAGAVRLDARVNSVSRGTQGGWELSLADGSRERGDAVILAPPAFAAAELLKDLDAELSAELAAIRYASSATMCLAFRGDQVPHGLDGAGFVVPAVEVRTLIAVTFSSVKFAHRAPEGMVLMRAFLGGAMHPHVYAMEDADLVAGVMDDLRRLIGVRGEPLFTELHRWPRSMPQYPVNHLQRVAKMRARVSDYPGLAVAGNAFGGVGIPDCVNSAEIAAEHVMHHLARLPDRP